MIHLTSRQALEGFYFSYCSVDLALDVWDSIKEAMINKCSYSMEQASSMLEDIVKTYISALPTPVCVLHSSGVDSTFMLLMASECFESKDIKAVYVGEGDTDESIFCKLLWSKLGIEGNTYNYDKYYVLTVLKDMIINDTYKDWFYSSSLVPTTFAMEKASQFNSVITGDGGDELFCGYDRYLLRKYWRINASWLSCLKFLSSSERFQKLCRFFKYGYEGTVSMYSIRDLLLLCNIDYSKYESDPLEYSIFRTMWYKVFEDELCLGILDRLMLLDIGTELFGVEKQKVDTAIRMSAIQSTISSPFMKIPVIKFACSLPEELKFTWKLGRKAILRRCIQKRFRRFYIDFPDKKKRGFAASSLCNDLREGLLYKVNSLKSSVLPFINKDTVAKLCFEHTKKYCDNTQKLWGLLVWKELYYKGIVSIVDKV